MNLINSYTSWQPLEEVIVGRAYTPDYFDFIENAQVRNQLQQILNETEEDLDVASEYLEGFGLLPNEQEGKLQMTGFYHFDAAIDLSLDE